MRTLLGKNTVAENEARVQSEIADTKGTRSLAVQTRQQLQQQAPELSSLVSVTPVTVQEIQGICRPDEVLVEYYAEGKELYAFVLSKAACRASSSKARG